MKECLEDNHTVVINVGGRFFDHFLHLFDSTKPNTIHKKIACITDRDPESKIILKGNFKKCYPYEYNLDSLTYEYKFNLSALKYPAGTHPNITFFTQDETKGKTLEYDLLVSNPTSELLLTPSISNHTEILKLMKLYSEGKTSTDLLAVLRSSDENDRIIASINSADVAVLAP